MKQYILLYLAKYIRRKPVDEGSLISVAKQHLYEMTEGDGIFIATLAEPDGNYFQLMPPWGE